MTASVSISCSATPWCSTRLRGTDLEPLGQRRRLGAVVRLEVADDDVDALAGRLAALLEHAVGLAHSGGGAQQDPESAAHAATDSRARSTLCDHEVDQLDADERRDDAAEPVDEQIPAQERGRADRPVAHAAQRQRDQDRDDERVEDDRRGDRARAACPAS